MGVRYVVFTLYFGRKPSALNAKRTTKKDFLDLLGFHFCVLVSVLNRSMSMSITKVVYFGRMKTTDDERVQVKVGFTGDISELKSKFPRMKILFW